MTVDGLGPGGPGMPSEGEPPLARGVALLAAGRHREALDAASAAYHAESGRPESHYLYGQAWAALGEHAFAERAFPEALQLRPSWADAWVNYGVARYRRGAVEDAKVAMRQVLLRSRGHSTANASLGAFLRITGGGANDLLRYRLARDPADAGARLNLVANLLGGKSALALLEDEASCRSEIAPVRRWHPEPCSIRIKP